MVKADRKYRILVVDDCRDTVDALAALLRIFGHDPRVARTGREALMVAQTFDPEVAFLDIALPDISGFDIAREIRADRPLSYLIALTGHVRAIDRERAYRAGFDLHVAKPIGAQSLLMVLEAAHYANCQRTEARPRAAATCSTT